MHTPIPDLDRPTPLLGGLTPREFMRDYWQKKPLLVRQAIPGFQPPVTIRDVQTLARREEVESRLITHGERGWSLKHGPFRRLPPATQPNWTLLVQSVDLHDDASAALMRQFRFISDARLDDLMISIATDGGGVGPHFDSYDVFLLQGHGRRRWRTSRQADRALVPGLPLKILADFQPEADDILEPGDMLYLPPHVCHDGVAIGNDCMTLSIGFRVPSQATLARGLLEAAADQISAQHLGDPGLYGHPCLPGPDLAALYTDAGEPATRTPAALPDSLVQATLDTLSKVRLDRAVAARFLGQWLTSLPDSALFDPADEPLSLSAGVPASGRLTLDRCTRLMYCGQQVFINGEVAPLAASPGLEALADQRMLDAGTVGQLPPETLAVLDEWLSEGWLHWED
ncbi:cupin domain-containing protein [Castellaniella sp.]|jgi:50S ribosomal protein L16 3-hydroxylase|uniref:cupin domain-containing protein n=1 Tax=Castellaniella sp. TaxID=1955812 RepID=UPI002D80F257|nr:cupin domain-containing protein [Castellaniella sp.]HET8704054.1 cupin domain-containing protein [Castellaniella sp.]